MNASPKQVEAYRNFILIKRRYIICKLQQVILRIWRNCCSSQRVNATIKTERIFGTEEYECLVSQLSQNLAHM